MSYTSHISSFLPTTLKEVRARDWDQLDVILFTGDAYVDHPSFGIPVIGRVLQDAGYRVAIVPQPNWKDDLRDFKKLGQPRLFFGVSAGAMDSMVNHYTARKRIRSNDAYTPGGAAGFRPDYPTLVYTRALKEHFPDTPVIIGGVEASLRRFTHFDYWQNELKRSILLDSGADMLIYGMGEKSILQIAELLDKGVAFENLDNLSQTAIIRSVDQAQKILKDMEFIPLNSHEICLKDKKKFAENFASIEVESNRTHPQTMVQECEGRSIIVHPPLHILKEKELDRIYDLPFTREPHPKYRKRGPIPAFEMIKDSVNTHRGCFGGCSFCTISAHQGKFVQSRSESSILKEVEFISMQEGFKGHITDLGGPSANMYKMKGRDQKICDKCKRNSCLHPRICKNLDTDHRPMIDLYKKASKVPGIKKITIGSGIRYDFLNQDNEVNHFKEYFRDLVKHHVSGRLKVAPEHSSDEVLNIMRKPDFELFKSLYREFKKINRENHNHQQLIPYFISSHPACEPEDMAELALVTKEMGYKLEQVQGFTPTPMTLATVMYYTGLDPYTLQPVFTAKTDEEKSKQSMFFFWYKKEYREQIKNELRRIGRADMISKLLER